MKIDAVGIFTKEKIDFLGFTNNKIGLAFSGNTFPTTLEVGFVSPDGAFIPFTNGTVVDNPTTLVVNSIPGKGIAINVSGGSPDFEVDDAGASGPLRA